VETDFSCLKFLWVKFRPDGRVLIPLDGVWYYSSQNIHVVLPLMPEMIRNEDGQAALQGLPQAFNARPIVEKENMVYNF
jgi:hypothetical protein